MGTTADKLNYLNNTKGKLKTVINLMGTEIEDTDTFRSYSNKLQEQILKVIDGEVDLFEEYPKTTTTGTSASIQNTINHKMKIELDSVELSQEGTPIPDSPVDVNVITGSNNIKITDGTLEQNYPITLSSKNLLDFNNITVGKLGTAGTVTVDGDIITFTANNQNVYGIEIDLKDLKPNTTYTVSNLYENTGSFANSCGWRYYDGTSYTVLAQAKTYFNFTTGDGTTNKLYFYLGSPLTYTGTLTLYNIQLLEGLVLQADIPDYQAYFTSIDYCKIGNYADQFFKNTNDSEFYDNTLLENEWYLKKNILKVTFDGSNDEVYAKVYGSIYNNKCLFYLRNIPHNNTNYQLMKSNRFVPTAGVSEYYQEGINTSYNAEYLGLVLNADRLTDYSNEALRVFFQNNNCDVYLVAETPTYIHISQTDYPTLKTELDNLYNNAKSYDGQTNITQTNDDLSFNLKISTLNDVEV